MFLSKSKIAAGVVLIVVSLTGGTGLIYQTQAAQDTPAKEKQGLTLQRTDESAGEKGDKRPELERRIGELEKQIQSLTVEVKALQKKLEVSTARQPAKTEARVFRLRNSRVDEVAQLLEDIFSKNAGSVIRITTDHSTNALIVMAGPNDLRLIEAILTHVDKLPKKRQNQDKIEE